MLVDAKDTFTFVVLEYDAADAAPDIAIGADGGVNAPVYIPTPFAKRKLLIYPVKN